MVEHDDYTEVARMADGRLRAGANVEDVIRTMRTAGFSVVDCIQALYESGLYPADEAKEVVHNSDAWADRRRVHDKLHEELIREIGGNSAVADKDSDGS